MQATVLDFDPDRGAGRVVLDNGQAIEFGAAAFAAGGLRLLRPGQRVRVTVDGDRVLTSVTIATLPEPRA